MTLSSKCGGRLKGFALKSMINVSLIKNENINDTASRELFEEKGAKKFNITPVCIYSVEGDKTLDYTESFGQLFYSEVETLGKLSDFEIKEIKFFDNIPDNLTYPLIQPFLHKKVFDFLRSMKIEK